MLFRSEADCFFRVPTDAVCQKDDCMLDVTRLPEASHGLITFPSDAVPDLSIGQGHLLPTGIGMPVANIGQRRSCTPPGYSTRHSAYSATVNPIRSYARPYRSVATSRVCEPNRQGFSLFSLLHEGGRRWDDCFYCEQRRARRTRWSRVSTYGQWLARLTSFSFSFPPLVAPPPFPFLPIVPSTRAHVVPAYVCLYGRLDPSSHLAW